MTNDQHVTDLLNRALELIRQGRAEEAVPLLREVQALVRTTVH